MLVQTDATYDLLQLHVENKHCYGSSSAVCTKAITVIYREGNVKTELKYVCLLMDHCIPKKYHPSSGYITDWTHRRLWGLLPPHKMQNTQVLKLSFKSV